MKRLKAVFRVTGGDEEATEFCGLEIERDWNAHTITLKQGAFARQLMDKCDMWGALLEPTLFRVVGDKLQPSDGAEDTGASFDYAMCLAVLA